MSEMLKVGETQTSLESRMRMIVPWGQDQVMTMPLTPPSWAVLVLGIHASVAHLVHITTRKAAVSNFFLCHHITVL